MNQYQADFSLNRTQRLEVFCFASSVSGTRNFDQFRLKRKKKHVVYKVCCNLPRWYKWNIVLSSHKSVLLLMHALELKFTLFFHSPAKRHSPSINSPFNVSEAYTSINFLPCCPVKGAKPVFLDDAMDYRILSAYLSFSDKCLFEWE